MKTLAMAPTRFAIILGLSVFAPLGLAGQAANELPPGGDGPTPRHPEAQKAIDELKSPYCPGLMLEVCPSGGGMALRDSLQMLAEEGRTSEELVDWVVANHGEHWRALPKRSGMSLVMAWMVPPFGVLLGLGLVVVSLRRMRSNAPRVATDGEAITDEEEQRLREAMRELDAEEEATFF